MRFIQIDTIGYFGIGVSTVTAILSIAGAHLSSILINSLHLALRK